MASSILNHLNKPAQSFKGNDFYQEVINMSEIRPFSSYVAGDFIASF